MQPKCYFLGDITERRKEGKISRGGNSHIKSSEMSVLMTIRQYFNPRLDSFENLTHILQRVSYPDREKKKSYNHQNVYSLSLS